MNRFLLWLLLPAWFHSCGNQPAEPSPQELTARYLSLKDSLDARAVAMDRTLAEAQYSIRERISQGDRKSDYLLDLMREIEENTQKWAKEIKNISSSLMRIADWDAGTSQFAKPEERTENERHWKVDGKGKRLMTALDEYIQWANSVHKRYDTLSHPPIASMTAPSQEGGDWVNETFAGHTVAHNIVTLQELQLNLLDISEELILYYSSKVIRASGNPVKIDSIYLDVKPVKERVKAGEDFEALVTIMPEGLEIYPEFIGSGSFSLLPDGKSARFTARATGGFPSGKSEKKQSYYLKVRLPKADGTMGEFNHEGSFTVVK